MSVLGVNSIKLRLLIISATLVTSIVSGCGSKENSEAIQAGGEDPYYQYQWHLTNTGQAVFARTSATAGADIHFSNTLAAGITGAGIRVIIADTAIESTHEDLASHLLLSEAKNYLLPAPYLGNPDNSSAIGHGTSVAGTIGAIADNAIGGRGVAPNASLLGANVMDDGADEAGFYEIFQLAGDILNQSYGTSQDAVYGYEAGIYILAHWAATQARGGKGMNMIHAAGNDFYIGGFHNKSGTRYGSMRTGNSNFDPEIAPEMIAVGALNANGLVASYSSSGSNLWITAPSGEDGVYEPATMTTERSGCSRFGSISSADLSVFTAFDQGSDGNSNCAYTVQFNGTSSATPVISGVIALLLEVNPQLIYRDIKHILASTARKVDDNYVGTDNPFVHSPTGHVWEKGWITNTAGFHFHNAYGFGAVDTDAAVSMAKATRANTLGQLVETFQRPTSGAGALDFENTRDGINLSIPDNSADGVTDSMTLGSRITVEQVVLSVTVSHTNVGDIGIELTAPSGTKSTLKYVNDALDGLHNLSDQVFISNAFYGESSAGTWQIKVIDGYATSTGTLNSWAIGLTGH